MLTVSFCSNYCALMLVGLNIWIFKLICCCNQTTRRMRAPAVIHCLPLGSCPSPRRKLSNCAVRYCITAAFTVVFPVVVTAAFTAVRIDSRQAGIGLRIEPEQDSKVVPKVSKGQRRPRHVRLCRKRFKRRWVVRFIRRRSKPAVQGTFEFKFDG